MARAHINPKTLEVGKCSAEVKCPFGGAENHFSTLKIAKEEAANRAKSQANKDFNVITKDRFAGVKESKRAEEIVHMSHFDQQKVAKSSNVEDLYVLGMYTNSHDHELLQNPMMPAEVIDNKIFKAGYMMSIDLEIFQLAVRHPNITDEALKKIVALKKVGAERRPNKWYRQELLNEPEISGKVMPLNERFLKMISDDKEWLKSEKVREFLMNHPITPMKKMIELAEYNIKN